MLHAERQAAGMLKGKSFGMWYYANGQAVADISRDHSAIIFSAKLHSED